MVSTTDGVLTLSFFMTGLSSPQGTSSSMPDRKNSVLAHAGPERRFGALVIRDVVVDLEDGQGPAMVVPLQGPVAGHHNTLAIPLGMTELPAPSPRAEDLGFVFSVQP